MPIDDIISDIESSVSRLVTQPVFIEWLGKNTVDGGDYIVINDSFVYRATSTVKSQKHLVLRAKPPVSTLEEAASEKLLVWANCSSF